VCSRLGIGLKVRGGAGWSGSVWPEVHCISACMGEEEPAWAIATYRHDWAHDESMGSVGLKMFKFSAK
jgi:hypothetical protein